MIDPEERCLPGVPEEIGQGNRETIRRSEAGAYAQLLVSEIRLYHEADVIGGRHARDLERRLSAPIGAARERYARRFPLASDQRAFDEALVRILAGGDPSRLGRRG